VRRSGTDGTSWPTTRLWPATPRWEPEPNTGRDRSVVHNLHVHLVFVAKYRRGVLNTQMLNPCEQVIAQVWADFDTTLAEFNEAQDHVHLLVQHPPKMALSYLVNSLKGVWSRRLRQDFTGRINQAGMREGPGPRRTSPDHAAARHCTSSMTTSQTRNDPTKQGFLPALKDRVSTPDHR
jgi:putative transposase